MSLKNKITIILLLLFVRGYSQNNNWNGSYSSDPSNYFVYFLKIKNNVCLFEITQGRHLPVQIKCKVNFQNDIGNVYFLEALENDIDSKTFFSKNKFVFSLKKENNELEIINLQLVDYLIVINSKIIPIKLKEWQR